MSDDLDEIMDGLALWQEHRPQTAEDWVGVAKRCAADETFDHTKSTPIFGAAFLLAREVAATTDERPVRLPVPAPETLDSSRLVARVEELTQQLADANGDLDNERYASAEYRGFAQIVGKENKRLKERGDWLAKQLTGAVSDAECLAQVTELALARGLAGSLRDALAALEVQP